MEKMEKKAPVKAEKKATAKAEKKATKAKADKKAAAKKADMKKAKKKAEPPKPVNINTASEKELQQLKGVGPKTAKAIADYRKKHGEFKSAEDLMKVKGIGKKTLGNNKDLIKTK
ncbi:hypothetical protein AAU61_02870 [Desulfocarbo indianensis]|nr:hypothetical protein AAU61_02870 [Desulfocarbo indianensis]